MPTGVLTIEPTPSAAAPLDWLPCSVAFDGPCQRQKYFQITGGTEANLEYESMLRGRLLKGIVHELPEGYVVAATQQLESVAEDGTTTKAWKSTAVSKSIRVWDHDVPPQPQSSSQLKAMEWLSLAPKLHAPIAAEDVDAMLAAS